MFFRFCYLNERGGGHVIKDNHVTPPLVHFLFLFVLSAFRTEEVITVIAEEAIIKKILFELIIVEVTENPVWISIIRQILIDVMIVYFIYKSIFITLINAFCFFDEFICECLLNLDFPFFLFIDIEVNIDFSIKMTAFVVGDYSFTGNVTVIFDVFSNSNFFLILRMVRTRSCLVSYSHDQ